MSRAAVLIVGLVLPLTLVVGCDDKKSSQTAGLQSAVQSAADAGKKQAEEAMKKGKDEAIKPIEAMLPQIEEKIKGLTGDAKMTATTKLADLKKLIADFMAAAPDKWESMKGQLTEKFTELKKLVGL